VIPSSYNVWQQGIGLSNRAPQLSSGAIFPAKQWESGFTPGPLSLFQGGNAVALREFFAFLRWFAVPGRRSSNP
jgi:hypothetical protein